MKENGRTASKERGSGLSSNLAAAISERGDSDACRVRIKLMAERRDAPGVLIRDVYFEGGDVLRCYRGRFLFALEGREPVAIGEGETIVVYPDQRVTIEALEKTNELVYATFEGPDVSSWFDRIGFFNGIHGPTSTQIELFRDVKRRLEERPLSDPHELVVRLSDALVTYAHDLSVGENALVGAAIRQMRENLGNRIVRLTPLYEQLRVGHTALNRAFKRAGVGRPAEFIRREQMRLVVRQLKHTRKPIAEIAAETGFISTTHFANFIKRNAGMTAREIRQRGKTLKNRNDS
jgi:AraC-like DNA-binding protein